MSDVAGLFNSRNGRDAAASAAIGCHSAIDLRVTVALQPGEAKAGSEFE